MLVFNEGVPRAGKSFDAVRTHILASLKAGRRVYARLNGLDHEKIAAHLGMPVADVRALLVLVESGQVKTFFAAQQDASGAWFIPDDLKDALFVIDECHEFYVSTRDALAPEVEQFFALHGQNGMDGVLLSQWYKRLHVAIRARIERKNVFQKLTAAGMKGSYRVNFFQTVAPDKFESTGGETRKYDPKIFPLYSGYAPGAENDEVYSEGGRTIWHALRLRAMIIVPIGLVSAWYLVHFFTGGAKFTKDANATEIHATQAAAPAQGVAGKVAAQVAPPRPAYTAQQAYVADLATKGRIRLAARIESERGTVGLIEWVDSAGIVVDRLTTRQLSSLGWNANFLPFGVELSAAGQSAIATAWPLNVPLRDDAPRLYNLSPEQEPSGAAAERSEPAAPTASSGRSHLADPGPSA
jgi:zona occludens toxin